MSGSPVHGLGGEVCERNATHHVHWRGDRSTGRGAVVCSICGHVVREVPLIGHCEGCGAVQLLDGQGACFSCDAPRLVAGFTGPVD